MKQELLFCALVVLFICTLTIPICYALQKVTKYRNRKLKKINRLIF